MYQSALNKLTAWYVAALLVIVVLFSLPVFSIASNKLERSSFRQGQILRELPGRHFENQPPELRERREAVVEQERAQLLRQIIFVDIMIVALGAVASYYFAKRTLRPIEEAHIAQTRFTADASHQLRTPLTTMQSEIEVALRDKQVSKKELSLTLTSNLEEIARLKNLSDQLLSLTKIDSTKLTKVKFSFSKLVVKRINDLEKQYGIEIDTDITDKIVVSGDESLIGEVIAILVDNAVKYADKAKPNIKILLTKSSSSAVLSVNDNGKGIDPKELPRIFERFYRGKQTAGTTHGNGLGLALAYEVVTLHSGHISASSKESNTQFIVTLPFA